MRDTRHRQLCGLLTALLAIVSVAANSGTAAQADPASNPQEELRAVKQLETAWHGSGAAIDERAKLDRLYAELEARHPRDAAIKNGRAEFLWSTDRHEAAVAKWREAERLEPTRARVLNHLGGARLASGDVREALRYFTRASAAEPANPLYHFNVANVAFLFRHDLGETEENLLATAARHFAEASRLAPGDAEYVRAYAELFYSMPQPDWRTALAAWQRYRDLSPNKAFALLNLARVHMKLGEKAEARACLALVEGREFERLKTRLSERIDRE